MFQHALSAAAMFSAGAPNGTWPAPNVYRTRLLTNPLCEVNQIQPLAKTCCSHSCTCSLINMNCCGILIQASCWVTVHFWVVSSCQCLFLFRRNLMFAHLLFVKSNQTSTQKMYIRPRSRIPGVYHHSVMQNNECVVSGTTVMCWAHSFK